MSIAETPHKNLLDKKFIEENVRTLRRPTYAKLGQSLPAANRLPEKGRHRHSRSANGGRRGGCVDDIAVVRSMWTNDNDHGHNFNFIPAATCWTASSLPSAPGSITALATSTTTCRSSWSWEVRWPIAAGHRRPGELPGPGARWRPARDRPRQSLAFGRPDPGVYREEQAAEFDLLARLTSYRGEYPDDPAGPHQVLRAGLSHAARGAGIFGFQQRRRHAKALRQEPRHDRAVRQAMPRGAADRGTRRALRADLPRRRRRRRLGRPSNLRGNHANCAKVDKPIAGLLRDLKQRGLLDETLVVWATEFGRSPGSKSPTAATTTRMASRSGWPAAASRAASSTARRTKSASPPSKTATT